MRFAVSCTLFFLAACASARPADVPLRVLTYNIHAGKDAGGVDNLERVAALVRSTKADVVLLQEVDRNTTRSGHVDQFDVLKRLTKFDGVYAKALDFQGGEYGIAMLTRWPVADSRVIHYQDDPKIEPRVVLVVDTRRPQGRLRIVDTHLDASEQENYRNAEVAQLARTISSQSPQLAGGDFNSTPDSAVHATMQSSGLRDAWLECGKGAELTYPADTPVRRIDYLYLNKNWKCDEATVLDSQASDHRAVLFTLRAGPRK